MFKKFPAAFLMLVGLCNSPAFGAGAEDLLAICQAMDTSLESQHGGDIPKPSDAPNFDDALGSDMPQSDRQRVHVSQNALKEVIQQVLLQAIYQTAQQELPQVIDQITQLVAQQVSQQHTHISRQELQREVQQVLPQALRQAFQQPLPRNVRQEVHLAIKQILPLAIRQNTKQAIRQELSQEIQRTLQQAPSPTILQPFQLAIEQALPQVVERTLQLATQQVIPQAVQQTVKLAITDVLQQVPWAALQVSAPTVPIIWFASNGKESETCEIDVLQSGGEIQFRGTLLRDSEPKISRYGCYGFNKQVGYLIRSDRILLSDVLREGCPNSLVEELAKKPLNSTDDFFTDTGTSDGLIAGIVRAAKGHQLVIQTTGNPQVEAFLFRPGASFYGLPATTFTERRITIDVTNADLFVMVESCVAKRLVSALYFETTLGSAEIMERLLRLDEEQRFILVSQISQHDNTHINDRARTRFA